MNEKEVVVGIDLGTTNSCIAIWDKYKVEVIPNDYGERTTPSIVHFFDENKYCVGLDASIFLNIYPKSTIYSIKRVIGLNFNSEEVGKFKNDWPFKLINQERNKIGIEIEIGKSKFTVNPETISCYILKKLKSDAENFLKGKKVKKAVLAVPHYFNSSQKEATLNAANLAGFEDVILINEPTAASMAFSFDKILEKDEKKMIIFDLGGGTFDVSLLTIEEGIIDVVCVNGDTKLGGNDIDVILCTYIEKKIREMNNFKDLKNLDEIIYHQKEKIKSKCEFVKRNLTNQTESVLNLPGFNENEDVSIKITRQELDDLCEDFLKRIEKILDKLFEDAKTKKKSNSYNKSKIDYIILIGGATRMPLIVNFVEKYFGKKPITSFNPDETVAIGAALRGETLFNYSPYLDSLHLIDVIPLNIGVMEGEDNKTDVILKRNTYIPCKNKKIYNPMEDYQTSVEIKIYEGENKYSKDNTLLGSFLLDITPKKSIDSQIEISFVIDEQLFLHVSAEQISEGKSKKVCIKKKNQLLTDKEMEIEKKKIEKSKITINMNENEKKIYSQITSKKKEFFSSENIKNILEGELDEFIMLIEGYINEFHIKDNNIHFINILFRLYNYLISKKKIDFNELDEKIGYFFEKISEIDIFYILNFISKYNLEKSFQENITIKISSFFSKKGISYLIDDFKKNKNISFELFQLSLKLIDNLFAQNNELKKDQKILDLIQENNQYLKYIKINDMSLKIKDIYNKNQDDKKYLNHIIKLYQTIVNLITNKDEVEYIKDFETLYKLGNDNDYLLNILDIMNTLYEFIKNIYTANDDEKFMKYKEFKHKLDELKKYYEESKNVDQEYFKKDFDNETYKNIEQTITRKYNEEKEKDQLTNFIYYIIDNYPPIAMSISIVEFKKRPSIKILLASYQTSFIKKYSYLINKEKLRKKIHSFLSEMFNNNIVINPLDNNILINPLDQVGEDTDSEGDDDNETLMTNYN